jgi:iron(III) transport system ATP-binding protein
VAKSAYLGSYREYTFDTALGAIFVVSPEVQRVWQPGDAVSLRLAGHGLSVVAA